MTVEPRSLDALGRRLKTDKSSRKHDYLRTYEEFLAPFRNEKILVLELGIGAIHIGHSLKLWADYFPRADIVGVDIVPATKAAEAESDRIAVEIGDLGDRGFVRTIARKYRPTVIVDDASHRWSHQIMAAEELFGRLRPGGVYICEDLHTSFRPMSELDEPRFADTDRDAASWFGGIALSVLGRGSSHRAFDAAPLSEAQAAIAAECRYVVFTGRAVILKKKDGGLRLPI